MIWCGVYYMFNGVWIIGVGYYDYIYIMIVGGGYFIGEEFYIC